jgi:hypothetical protein
VEQRLKIRSGGVFDFDAVNGRSSHESAAASTFDAPSLQLRVEPLYLPLRCPIHVLLGGCIQISLGRRVVFVVAVFLVRLNEQRILFVFHSEFKVVQIQREGLIRPVEMSWPFRFPILISLGAPFWVCMRD